MAENRQIQNTISTRRNSRVLDSVTTTNATPTIAYSIPLAEGRASFIQAKVIALKSDLSAASDSDIQCGFRRASGGNVTKCTPSNNKGFEVTNGDFPNPQPSVNLVANTGSQTIDVEVTGKAATTIKNQRIINRNPYRLMAEEETTEEKKEVPKKVVLSFTIVASVLFLVILIGGYMKLAHIEKTLEALSSTPTFNQ